MRRSWVIVRVVCLLLAAAANACAAPQTVDVGGYLFRDGGTIAPGSSFTVDLAAQTVTNVNITTTAGSAHGPFIFSAHYDAFWPAISCFGCTGLFPPNLPVFPDLVLGFSGVHIPPGNVDPRGGLGLFFLNTPQGLKVVRCALGSSEDFLDAGFRSLVAPAPTVTAISPASGRTSGGTPVTITGTNFECVTGVTIGGAAATGVSMISATSISATTPAGSAGTAEVRITTEGGTSGSNTLYSYVPPPTVTSIAPASGPSGGGTPVTITGSNFTGVASVTIGGAAATGIDVLNATTITATTPPGVAGAQSVVVTTPGGPGTGTTKFTYIVHMLDIDGNGHCDALTDGLLVIRSLFGLSGTALIDGAVGPLAARDTPEAMASYLATIGPALDIDGNGQIDALTDGLLVIRYLFGLRGNALINGAYDPLGTRATVSAIETYLDSLVQPLLP